MKTRMITKRKVAFVFTAVLSAAAVFLVVSFNAFVAKNRNTIREEIRRRFGRDVAFDQLRPSLWGGLGLSVRNLRIAEDPFYAATPFIQTRELKMLVQWLPLLFGNVIVTELVLEEPEIQVIKNEQGSLNLSELGRKRQEAESGVDDSYGGEKNRSGVEFLVSAINVRNGKIDYIDRSFQEPVEIRARNAHLEIRGLGFSGAMNVQLTANLFDAHAENLYLGGRVGPVQREKSWSEQPLDLELHADPLPVPQLMRAIPFLREKIPQLGITGPLQLQAKLSGNFRRLQITDLVASGSLFGAGENNTRITGRADLSNGSSWPRGEIYASFSIDPVQLEHLRRFSPLRSFVPPALAADGPLAVAGDVRGDLNNPRINATVKAERAEIRYGGWAKKPRGIRAELSLNLERTGDRLMFHDSSMTLHDSRVDFSGFIENSVERNLILKLRAHDALLAGWDRILLPLAPYNAGGKIGWELSIKTNLGPRDEELDIQGSLWIDGMLLTDKKTGLGIERADGRVIFRGKEARIDAALIRLANSSIALRAIATDLTQPLLRFTARASKLRLADLTENPLYQRDELRSFSGAGELRLADGSPRLAVTVASADGALQEISYRNLRADVAWSPRSLSIENFSLQALSGTFRARGLWNTANGNTRHLDLTSHIESMDLSGLLSRKFPKFKDHVEGRLELSARLRAESRNGTGMRRNLSGRGEARLRSGALKDFNLVQRVLSKIAGLPGIGSLLTPRLAQRYAAVLATRDTPFATLQANFTVEKEQIRTDKLILAAQDYSIHGEGWIGFDKATQWDAVLTLSPRFTQDVIREHKNVRYMVDHRGHLAVPFRLEGSLSHLVATPDVDALKEALEKGLLGNAPDHPRETTEATPGKTRRESGRKQTERPPSK